MLKNLFLIYLLLSINFLVIGQQAFYPTVVDPLSEGWRFTYFRELEGKGIRCVKNDGKGNYWMGVNNGVIRYDGYNFHQYGILQGLKGKNISEILVGSKRMYVMSSAGIFYLEHEKWLPVFENSGKSKLLFKAMRELSDGSIACATDKGLLIIRTSGMFFLTPHKGLRLPGTKPVYFEAAEGMTDISDVLEYVKGELWMGISYNEGGEILAVSLDGIRNGVILETRKVAAKAKVLFGEGQKFLKANDGRFWVINNSCRVGINVYDGKSWKNIKLGARFGGDEYSNCIASSSDGKIWVGALGKVYLMERESWQMYKAPANNIPGSQVMIFPDGKDKLWILGLQTKLYRVDLSEDQWQTFAGLNFQLQDKYGNQWFISREGKVVRRFQDTWASYDVNDGLIDAPVRMLLTKNGTIWVAGSHDGIASSAFFNGYKFEKQLYPELSWSIDDRSMFEDSKGSLWLGASVDHDSRKKQLGGIIQIKNPLQSDQQLVHHPFLKNGLSRSSIYGIGESADGKIWIGGGKLLFYEDNWLGFKNEDFQQFINVVYSDKNRNVYVGSRHYGMYVFNGKNWRHFHSGNGLTSNTIISIAKDKTGHLYALTDEGVSYFDGQHWTNDVFPSAMSVSHEGGNIQTDETGNLWLNISSREWKRRTFSSQRNAGFSDNEFKSFCYSPDKNPPTTRIVSVPRETGSGEAVTINFTGQDFMGKTAVNKLQYSFRIGTGKWSEYSQKNFCTFQNLKAGTYSLAVKCRDIDFNEDKTPALLKFTVQLPWWQRPVVLCFFVLCFAVYLLVQTIIIKKNRTLKRLNTRLARANSNLERHNEIIAEQNELILQNQQEQQEKSYLLETKSQEIALQRDALEDMVKKVELLSASRENFFTNITHELKTPLTLIHGPVSRLSSGGLPKQEQQLLFSIIFNNIKRLQQLIEQLLEIKDIDSGVMDVSFEKVNMVHFADAISDTFVNMARERSVDFTKSIYFPNPQIMIDQDKVEKIIYNLLGNAFKYTPAGGSIALALEVPEENMEYFTIRVKDNGKGISPDKLKCLFEKNKTLDMSGFQRSFESTGIGLPYINQLVECLSGKIEVDSNLGEGTCFRVFLPLKCLVDVEPAVKNLHVPSLEVAPIAALEIQANNFQEVKGKKHTVLVVEDTDDMRTFLKTLLMPHYYVVEACNGKEALEVCQNCAIDLIVSDVMMPQMDGLEFCDKIKSGEHTRHIPILLLTSKGLEEQVVEGFEQGADAYISKPFNTKLLLLKMNRLLESRNQWQHKFAHDRKLKPAVVQVESADEKFIQRLMQVVEEHVSDSEFDIDKMADMLHLSHVQFIRRVKQLTGKKPIDLLKSFRMQRARDLLDTNKINISEVAYQVGYDLPNSFSRAFRKEFNVSPSEYLEQRQGKGEVV